MRTSRLLLGAGFALGAIVALLGIAVPGGGLHWFLHTPTGQLGVPLSIALIASGAVLRRLERAEERADALRSTVAIDRRV